jgi:two-component system chemotaxis response regulator CheB
MTRTKVLIVDDSALIRQMLTEMINQDPQLEVVGVAQDPYIAREKIKKLKPDVLTLDVEMPRMDGITFLKNVMRLRPMPVVMVSTLTEQGADVTLEALEIGAVDFVTKPKIDIAGKLQDYAEELITKIKVAATARVRTRADQLLSRGPDPKLSADAVLEKSAGKAAVLKTTDKIIAIGASTGGTEAIREVLEHMPADSPGIVIAQHIPPRFSTSFAQRMNAISAMTVYEAQDGMQILPGHAYIAPGNWHLIVERSGARYYCRLNDGPPVNRHRPSVDVLFRSVAQCVGQNAIGVILTGMGDDGARGLLEMKLAGAPTLAQDEASSVVWGMPGEAVKLGAAEGQLPLGKIAGKLISLGHG